MILYNVLFMDCSRSVDVQIVLCSHCQHVTSGTEREREREERTQTRQIGLLSNQLGNLGTPGDTRAMGEYGIMILLPGGERSLYRVNDL